MTIFSKESILLINNWEAVQDIMDAKKSLISELTKFLSSIEADLKNTHWWKNNWVFKRDSNQEVHVSKREWQTSNDHLVIIGIEYFSPECLFGDESSASLYVYVPGQRHELVNKLINKLAEKETEIIGEIDRKKSSYVIRKELKQFLPEEINDFESITRDQIMDFVSHYAHVLSEFDDVIKEYV